MKKKFLAGIIALFPIGLTLFICWLIIDKIGGILGRVFRVVPIVSLWSPFVHSILGFIALLIIIYIIGTITTSYLGRKLFHLGEIIITKIPLIRPIYNAGRKIIDALFINRSAFKSVVLVEFPRKGMYSLGFLTSESSLKTRESSNNVSVYIPVPNSFHLIVPRSEVTETDLPIDAALQIIFSGGIIQPTKTDLNQHNTKATTAETTRDELNFSSSEENI